jgi:hypothetical protein
LRKQLIKLWIGATKTHVKVDQSGLSLITQFQTIMNHYQTIVTILIIAQMLPAASFHVKIKAFRASV